MSNVEKICREWPHNWFGFYVFDKSQEGGDYRFADLPVVTSFVDSSWDYSREPELLKYLEASLCCAAPSLPTHHRCLLCKEMLPTDRYHWDGMWLWPASLAHYVASHSIRLPERMVAHIEQQDFKPPASVQPVSLEMLPWPPVVEYVGAWARFKLLFAKRPPAGVPHKR